MTKIIKSCEYQLFFELENNVILLSLLFNLLTVSNWVLVFLCLISKSVISNSLLTTLPSLKVSSSGSSYSNYIDFYASQKTIVLLLSS